MVQIIKNIQAWNKYTKSKIKNTEAINLLGYVVTALPSVLLYHITGQIELLSIGFGFVEGLAVVTLVYSNKMGKRLLEGGEAYAWSEK
jgi:hypothetical protein